RAIVIIAIKLTAEQAAATIRRAGAGAAGRAAATRATSLRWPIFRGRVILIAIIPTISGREIRALAVTIPAGGGGHIGALALVALVIPATKIAIGCDPGRR